MRYCYNCNHITQGQPLFCQFCGRSYNVKLCPRLHQNPRNAQVCSQCGSRALTTPEPKQPLWVSVAALALSFVPGLLLLLISFLAIVAVLHSVMSSPRVLVSFVFLALALTVLWAMWTRLPLALRRWIRKQMLDRNKERRP
jgi:hypothetical protein